MDAEEEEEEEEARRKGRNGLMDANGGAVELFKPAQLLINALV